MLTKILIQIQCVLLSLLAIASLYGIITGDLNFAFKGWSGNWVGISFIVLYSCILLLSIAQIVCGLLEGKIFGLISGTYSALTFIPFVCFIIVPVNVWFVIRRLQHKQLFPNTTINEE